MTSSLKKYTITYAWTWLKVATSLDWHHLSLGLSDMCMYSTCHCLIVEPQYTTGTPGDTPLQFTCPNSCDPMNGRCFKFQVQEVIRISRKVAIGPKGIHIYTEKTLRDRTWQVIPVIDYVRMEPWNVVLRSLRNSFMDLNSHAVDKDLSCPSWERDI